MGGDVDDLAKMQRETVPRWVTDCAVRPEWAELLLTVGAPTGHDGRPRRSDAKTITEALTAHGEDYDRALAVPSSVVIMSPVASVGGWGVCRW